jgi:hypothetical protein
MMMKWWLRAALSTVIILAHQFSWARAAEPAVLAGAHKLFLPLVRATGAGCGSASNNQYSAGPVYQWDTDNPVRPASQHADKNIALRGYSANPGANLRLVDLDSDDPTTPPQLATLFKPHRVPAFSAGYRNYHWNWAPSPSPGTRGSLNTDWPVTVLGMRTTAGEPLHVPQSGYNIGGGMAVVVLYADADTVALKFGREDSVAPHGYVLHVDNICTDPNLLSLYQQLNAPDGPRYTFYAGTPDWKTDYYLPNLAAGQVFGQARDGEIRVAIVDSGSWMDVRSCNEWWQIRPGGRC